MKNFLKMCMQGKHIKINLLTPTTTGKYNEKRPLYNSKYSLKYLRINFKICSIYLRKYKI